MPFVNYLFFFQLLALAFCAKSQSLQSRPSSEPKLRLLKGSQSIHIPDSLVFRNTYEQAPFTLFEFIPHDTLSIINTKSILLNEVVIVAPNSYKQDSLQLRRDFASVFNYKKPTLKDLFTPKAFFDKNPKPYYKAANTTADLVSLNLLSVLNFFGQKKNPNSKLQAILINEEQGKYIANTFSANKIVETTGLAGDSLQLFIDRYRPGFEALHDMSEYEIHTYIKKCYVEYTNPNSK